MKLMKGAAHVSNYIIANAVKVFGEAGDKVYGTPYKSDFQLVH